MRLAILTLALLPMTAHAQTQGQLGLVTGVLSGQFGVGVDVDVEHRADGLVLLGDSAVVVRSDVPYSAIGEPPSIVAGLGTFGVGWQFRTGDRSHVGPVGHLDFALLPWFERDCSMGDGCRHWNWLGSDRNSGVGVSLQPALGLRWELDGRQGARFDLNLSVQPTNIYDIAVPYAPRIDLGWTSRTGWGFGVKAWRYGLGLGLHRQI